MTEPFVPNRADVIRAGCGGSNTYCAASLETNYMNRFKMDPCDIEASASDNVRASNYNLYVPEYKMKECGDNAFSHCDTTSRFGARKVLQESFLQGRAQVQGSRGCFASGIKFLAEDVFSEKEGKASSASSMSLFAQPTQLKKSCGSISEMDMTSRLRPLPGISQGFSLGPGASLKGRVPTVLSNSRSFGKTRTLGDTNKYPEYADLKREQDDAMEE